MSHIEELKKPITRDELEGQFHAHITVSLDGITIDEVKSKALHTGWKVIVIDLWDANRQQKDVMLTKFFVNKSYNEIMLSIRLDCSMFTIEKGLKLERVKLEHESKPTLAIGDNGSYYETHIRTLGNTDQHNDIAPEAYDLYGLRCSNNPFEIIDRKTGHVVQFYNKRYYDGDVFDLQSDIDSSANYLKDQGLDIEYVVQEMVVYDSNLERDSWWG